MKSSEAADMDQNEKRIFLIQELLKENTAYRDVRIPADAPEQRQLLRGLMNVRMPHDISEEFLRIQDSYLQ